MSGSIGPRGPSLWDQPPEEFHGGARLTNQVRKASSRSGVSQFQLAGELQAKQVAVIGSYSEASTKLKEVPGWSEWRKNWGKRTGHILEGGAAAARGFRLQ